MDGRVHRAVCPAATAGGAAPATDPLLATGIAVMALYLLIAQYGFHHGVVLPVTYPMIALAVSLFGTVLIESLAASISGRRGRAIA